MGIRPICRRCSLLGRVGSSAECRQSKRRPTLLDTWPGITSVGAFRPRQGSRTRFHFRSPIPADPPPSLVLPAPLVCDAEDICTTLNAIMSMLANLTYHQSLLQRDVTLIQRQEVPFAYLPGPAFTELTGQGQFGVSAILGLAVAFSALPNYLGTNEADPPDYFEIGEISLGTADGWESRHAIRHAPQLILNVSGVITRVGYSFEPNITATITTLVREP